jgi:hypothetical protein
LNGNILFAYLNYSRDLHATVPDSSSDSQKSVKILN